MRMMNRKRMFACLSLFLLALTASVQTAAAVTYPPITVTYTDFEWITNVTFGAINNDSLDEGYGDFTTGMSASVTPGSTYNLSVTIEPTDSEYISAYFDWNRDGDFLDPGEEIFVADLVSTPGPHTVPVTVPAGAAIGDIRMRIVLSWNVLPVSFGTVQDGEAEDYTIYIPGPTITATAGANGTITPSGVIQKLSGDNQTFTITPDFDFFVTDVLVDGVSVGAVSSYTFSNITASHTISAGFGQYFWPPISSNDPSQEWITNVSFANSINNTSGSEGYGDFTSLPPAVLTPGVAYPLSVTINPSIDGDENIDVFFDWNRDGDFLDADEQVTVASLVATPGPHPESPAPALNVIVPTNAVGGETRMRVVLRYFDPPPSFGVIDWGEAEDYAVVIRPIITASASGNGTITPSGVVPVDYGTDQAFLISPAANHHIVDVVVDGVSKGPLSSYTFTNVTAPHTITASFAIDTNIIRATAGADGSILPAGDVSVNYGADQSFTITPIANHHVADVLVDGVSVGAQTTYTFSNVTAPHTIDATFAIDTHTISVTPSVNGSISPSGPVTVNHGGSQSFSINPAANYHVADVLVDGVSVGAVSTYDFTNITTDHTIAATFAVNTYTITASDGANGTISPSGPVTVGHGGSQSYTITPDPNYHVVDVAVDGFSQGVITTYDFVNVTADHTITATFAIDTNTITATAGANGSISPAGSVTVPYGGDQGFTITPDANHHVADVLVDGVSVGQPTSYTFTNVTGTHTIEAAFAIDTYSITASALGNGTISPAGTVTVDHGAARTFIFTPAANHHVVDVLVDGVSQGAIPSYTFTNVTASHVITVQFGIDTYMITATFGANGLIDPAGAVSVDYGADQTFSIVPATNYHVADVLVDGASVGQPTSYTFTNVTGAHTIEATFAIDTYTITATTVGNGTITPNGAVSVDHGGSRTFVITAATNHHILDVKVDGVSKGPISSYTFTNVTALHTIEASFGIDVYTITASAVGSGTISPAGAVSVDHGASRTFTITPDVNYHIVDVQVDGVSVGAVNSYDFANVTESHTITATFTSDTYVITATAGGNGLIDPAGDVSVAHGADQTFVIIPDANYHVADVLVDGVSMGTVTSYTFTNVIATHTITASFAVDTYTITTTATGNGLIDPGGNVKVNHGADQTFTITAAANHHIVDVLVDGVSVGARTSHTFTSVMAPHTIEAIFGIDTYAITATTVGNGTINPSGSVSVDHGADQTFTISPAANHHIVDVVVDGVSQGAISTYDFLNVTVPHTIEATFAVDTYVITATTVGNGTISPNGGVNVDHGADQTFTITAAANHHIVDVVVDGVTVGQPATYTFTGVTQAHTIEAIFGIDTYDITATAGGNGTISPSPTVTVEHGSNQSFVITPDPNYHVADVLVDGVSVGSVTGYDFTNITAAHTIEASFTIDTYVLSVEITGSGRGTVTSDIAGIDCGTDCQEVYDYGKAVVLTATPDPGSTFKGWSGECTGTDPTCTVTMDQARDVSADFYSFPWELFLPAIIGNAAP